MTIATFIDGPAFSPKRIAEGLLTSIDDVARSAGLGRDALSQLFYMVKVDKARFNKQVVPGDVLIMEVQMKRLIRNVGCFYGEAKVDGEVVASAEVMCAGAR